MSDTMTNPNPMPPEFYHRYEQVRRRLQYIGEALSGGDLTQPQRDLLKQERDQLVGELADSAHQGQIPTPPSLTT